MAGFALTVRSMPVEFLTDDDAAAYARFVAAPSQADLERVFFLDDEDRKLVDLRRGEHMKAGFALQLVTVRRLGTFLEAAPPGRVGPGSGQDRGTSRQDSARTPGAGL